MRPIFVWLLLVCACAAYYAISLHFFLRGTDDPATRTTSLLQTLGTLFPLVVCALIQFRAAKLAGATGLALWVQAAAGGIGAPLTGFFAMLIVIFILFGKTP